MKYKNIVLYSKNLPPEKVGGIETNAFYLIQKLMALSGVRLHVVTLTKKQFLLFRSKRVSFGEKRAKVYRLKKHEAQDAAEFGRLLLRMDCRPHDTVIYHNTLDLHRLYPAIKSLGYKQLARSGGNDIFFLNYEPFAADNVAKNFLQLDRLLVNSDYSYARAVHAGLDKSMLQIVKGGCECPAEVDVKPSTVYCRPIILTSCRLVDFKGVDDAIHACHLLDRQGLEFSYLIVGEGKMRNEIERLIAQYGLEKKCHLLGKVAPERMQDFYRLADIYLSSSKDILKNNGNVGYIHTETMGRSICEAQAYGLPVVTTDAGGSPEMIENDATGFVVRQGEPAAMAKALSVLMEDEIKRREMGARARRYAQQHLSWEIVFDRTLAIIDRLGSQASH